MTFDDLVVGKFNEIAVGACQNMAQGKTKGINPLYIYGYSGLGKTALMNCTYETSIDKAVYITGQDWVDECIKLLHKNEKTAMSKLYKEYDLIIIDDISCLEGKEATSEEFLRYMKRVLDCGKRMVVSGRVHPKDMMDLNCGIENQLCGGLICQLYAPSKKKSYEFLQKYARAFDVDISEELIELIAKLADTNFYVLQGILNRIIALYKYGSKNINNRKMRDLIPGLINEMMEGDV